MEFNPDWSKVTVHRAEPDSTLPASFVMEVANCLMMEISQGF